MLQLVLGIAGTGKTTWILKELTARAKQGEPSLLLVPEQFSSSAETLVLETLGDRDSALVEVVSFRTLAERILRESGGENLCILSDAGRAVYVRRALDTATGQLRSLGRSKRDTVFCNLCAQTLAELKTAGATPASLSAIASQTGDTKLSDLAVIFEAYEAVLAGGAMDPDDRLVLAARSASVARLENKFCYIDNFDGFTAPEYQMLEAMMQHCAAVQIALCCDSLQESDGGLGLFSPVRATAQCLLDKARRLSLPTPAPICLQIPRRSQADELLAVNLLLAGRVPEHVVCTGKLTLTKAQDRHAEVKLAAAEMRRLAALGVPYSQMALVCRDPSLYESIVRRELAFFDIPWHSDLPDSIEYSATIAFLRGALGLLRQGLVSGPILELLKTGLCGYAESQIATLENYVFTWRPKAADWRAPFTRHPFGLLQTVDKVSDEVLAAANSLRGEIIPILENFIAGVRGKPPRELSIGLYRLLDRFSAAKHLEENARRLEENGDYAWADRIRRAWDMGMEMLDQMAFLLENDPVSAAEYDELFLLLVRSTDFGQVQGTLESVIFTGADKMRLANPDYCFVLGLTEGEFPSKVGYSGLLTHADRDLLVENGIAMPGSFQNRILLEQMFLYRALTSPRKGLHLSWPACHAGVPGSMSSELTPLTRLLLLGPLTVLPAALAATPAAAFDQLCGLYRDNSPEAATLYYALENSGDAFATNMLPLLEQVDAPGHFSVGQTDSLRRLTGDTLRVSPTRAEHFFACRFSYFMEHVLHLRPRRRAELSPLESGTFVHHILEQVLLEVKGRFASCEDGCLQSLTDTHATLFIEANFPVVTLRTGLLLDRIKTTTFFLLLYLRDWAQHSQFKTDALELSIGEGGVSPFTLQGEDGGQMQVIGKVDRVDVLQKDGKTYLCVLDYKTGSRQFNLDEVLYGLNMQMLVYMDVLCKQDGGAYANAIPAGMLYLSSDPEPETGSRHDGNGPLYHLDGLLLDDPDILQAMDSNRQGIFLPIKYKQDGSPYASKYLASVQRIGGLTLYIESLLEEMALGVTRGDFPAHPLVKSGGARHCNYCPYRASCRHEYGRHETLITKQDDMWEKIDAQGNQRGVIK